MSVRHLWGLALLVGGQAPLPASAAPPATLTREEIYGRATEARKELKNVRADYSVDCKLLREIPSLKETPVDVTPAHVVFALSGDRRFIQVTPRDPGKRTKPYIGAFDGRSSYRYSLGLLEIAEGKTNSSEAYEFYCGEVLQMAYRDSDKAQWDNGLFYPHCLRPLPPGAAADYRVRPQTETVDGAVCHVVEWANHDIIWVDPALGYAYRRREFRRPHGGGSVSAVRWELSDFHKYGNNLWLPHRCVRRDYPDLTNPASELDRQHMELAITVNRLDVNTLTDADFDFQVSPGTMINSKDGRFQLAGDKGALLSELADQARGRRMPYRKPVFIIANVVLLSVVAAVSLVILRRSRRQRAGLGGPAA